MAARSRRAYRSAGHVHRGRAENSARFPGGQYTGALGAWLARGPVNDRAAAGRMRGRAADPDARRAPASGGSAGPRLGRDRLTHIGSHHLRARPPPRSRSTTNARAAGEPMRERVHTRPAAAARQEALGRGLLGPARRRFWGCGWIEWERWGMGGGTNGR